MLSLRTVGVVDAFRYIWSRQIGVIVVRKSTQTLSSSQRQGRRGSGRAIELDICLGGSRVIRCLPMLHGYVVSHTAAAVPMLRSAGMNYVSSGIMTHASEPASNTPQPAVERPAYCPGNPRRTRMRTRVPRAECPVHRQRWAAAQAAPSRSGPPVGFKPWKCQGNLDFIW
jgi:hypothetical protein